MTDTAGVSLTVSTVDDSLSPGLSALARRVRDIDAALDEIGGSLVTSTQQRFEDEVSPKGEPWLGLSTVTLNKRRREGKDGEARVLRDNSDLYDSLDHRVLAGQVQVGVTRVSGRIHQLGGMTGRNRGTKIDARPYLGISEADDREIEQILTDHIGGRS